MVVESLLQFLIENPEWGWVAVLGFGIEQLFAPWKTRTKKLIEKIETRVQSVEDGQKAQMTVIRALARVHEEIDTEEVDKYLVQNGAEPSDFIRDGSGIYGPYPEEEEE
jgi:hypothetical protein